MREQCIVVLLSMAMDIVQLSDATACAITKGTTEGHGIAACALLDKYAYDRIDYLVDIRRCQCTNVSNPFYVDGAVTEEMKETKA